MKPCTMRQKVIETGFPAEKKSLPEHLKYFWNMKDELYIIGNTPFKGKKMLIPEKLRPRILDGLHAGHQGVSSMRANARERLFWPRLDADIGKIRAHCRSCNENAPSQPAEHAIPPPEPELPFEQVAMDLCQIGGKLYLIYADRFSGWMEVALIKNTSFKSIKQKLLGWFRSYGVANEISSDGEAPFNSLEYTEFMKSWGIK